MSFPPYSPHTRCPKCGNSHLGIATRYEDARNGLYVRALRRTCARCGYSWHEAPLDRAST